MKTSFFLLVGTAIMFSLSARAMEKDKELDPTVPRHPAVKADNTDDVTDEYGRLPGDIHYGSVLSDEVFAEFMESLNRIGPGLQYLDLSGNTLSNQTSLDFMYKNFPDVSSLDKQG